MLRLLGKLLTWALAFFTKAKGPTAEARAGAAEAKLEIKETSDAAVADAIAARRDADTERLRDPDSRRAPDPYSRD